MTSFHQGGLSNLLDFHHITVVSSGIMRMYLYGDSDLSNVHKMFSERFRYASSDPTICTSGHVSDAGCCGCSSAWTTTTLCWSTFSPTHVYVIRPHHALTHWLVFTGREFRYEYNVKKNFTSAIATLNPFDLYSSAFVRPKTEENVNLEMNEPSDQHYCYRSHTAKFIPTIKNACIFSY